jgi:hypothetical protein
MQADQFRCLRDGCAIPLVAEHRDWPEPQVLFYWCWYCRELFAVVGDDVLGGRSTGSFVYHEADGWLRHLPGGTERDVELATSAIARIGQELVRRLRKRFHGP